MTNIGFVYLGIFVVIVGLIIMFLHPYQRGGVRLGRGRTGGSAGGPVYFVILLIGFGLIALGLYLRG